MSDSAIPYDSKALALAEISAVPDVWPPGHSRFEITMNLYTATVPEVLREAADRMDSAFVNARRQIGAPAVAALPASRAHRAETPGRVVAQVAAQRPAKGSETASGDGI